MQDQPLKSDVLPPIRDKVGTNSMQILMRRSLDGRKVVDGARLTDKDGVTYEEFTHDAGDKMFVVRPKHVTIDEVSAYANLKCKICNSKGYFVANIAKAKLKGPSDHVILSNKPFEGLNEEQRNEIIEEERKRKTWRVILPCDCAVKRMSKADPNFFVSDDRAIMFTLDYEEKAK
jgi:hypothetical protein